MSVCVEGQSELLVEPKRVGRNRKLVGAGQLRSEAFDQRQRSFAVYLQLVAQMGEGHDYHRRCMIEVEELHYLDSCGCDGALVVLLLDTDKSRKDVAELGLGALGSDAAYATRPVASPDIPR